MSNDNFSKNRTLKPKFLSEKNEILVKNGFLIITEIMVKNQNLYKNFEEKSKILYLLKKGSRIISYLANKIEIGIIDRFIFDPKLE